MKREIEKGEMLPKGYGFAWEDYIRNIYICYPFPLNHIIAGLRRMWIRVRHHPIDNIDLLHLNIEHYKKEIESQRIVIEKYREADASFLSKINKHLNR